MSMFEVGDLVRMKTQTGKIQTYLDGDDEVGMVLEVDIKDSYEGVLGLKYGVQFPSRNQTTHEDDMELVEKHTRKFGIGDSVKHPNHYNQDGGVECIDAIRASLGPEGFRAYCKGNCIKYLWRYEYKSGLEDLKKAQVYLGWLVETMEKESD